MKMRFKVTVDVEVNVDDEGKCLEITPNDNKHARIAKRHGKRLLAAMLADSRLGKMMSTWAISEALADHDDIDPDAEKPLEDVAHALSGKSGDFYREATAHHAFSENADGVMEALYGDTNIVAVACERVE